MNHLCRRCTADRISIKKEFHKVLSTHMNFLGKGVIFSDCPFARYILNHTSQAHSTSCSAVIILHLQVSFDLEKEIVVRICMKK
jgi:hypothetical protein